MLITNWKMKMRYKITVLRKLDRNIYQVISRSENLGAKTTLRTIRENRLLGNIVEVINMEEK